MSYRRVWIGGTSGLAQTFFNAFQEPRIGRKPQESSDEACLVFGHQTTTPAWVTDFKGLDYRQIDFMQPDEDAWKQILEADCQHVEHVLISVRPMLVSHHSFQKASKIHNEMIAGLQKFIWLLLNATTGKNDRPVHIIHVSSIAAIDHVKEQRLRSEASIPDPSSDSLYHPYDRFKRRCEEVLDDLVAKHPNFRITHVRLGAIFSDTKYCIQCNALALQARIGCYLTKRIDCNSARNVSVLLNAMLHQGTPVEAIRYFFYTRPLSFSSPVPYGEYLVAYRRAYDMILYLWIPVAVVQWVVSLVHSVAQIWATLPFVQSIDYLLQVTKEEHTFDLSLVGAAFPGVAAQEESLEECFRRRRYFLRRRR